MFDWLGSTVHGLQQWLYETAVQPLLFALGWMRYAEELFDFTEWVVLGAIEVVVLAVLLGVAERRWPAEPVTDRRAIRTDVLYKLPPKPAAPRASAGQEQGKSKKKKKK